MKYPKMSPKLQQNRQKIAFKNMNLGANPGFMRF